MPYFIHLSDPGFPDAPFPGERRLGPFLTLEEAQQQAINDVATGSVTEAVIYEARESEKRSDESKGGKAAYTKSQIQKRAQVLLKRQAAELARAQQEQTDLYRAIMPDGVTWDDAQTLARTMREQADAEAKRAQP